MTWLKALIPNNWRELLGWLVLIVLSAALSWLHGAMTGSNQIPAPPVPIFDPLPRADDKPHLDTPAPVAAGGLVCGSDARAFGVLAMDGPLPQVRPFGQTPAGQQPDNGDDPDVYLWAAAIKVTGKPLPARNQNPVGSCVGFGNICAIEYLMAMQVFMGRQEEFRELCQEALYAISRVNIGGNRIRGDGSVGIWAAEAAKKYGVLARGKYPGYDLTSYDPRRCREWGYRGVPAELLTLCKEHPVQDYARCESAADVRAALRAGYPVAVCSNQGFANVRDKDGFARAQGMWPHCMAFIGYRGGESGRKGFYIENSWGPNWIKGPVYPQGDMAPPEGGFWCDWSVADRMARQRDTFAFSDLVGFPMQNPWLVRRERPRGLRGLSLFARLQRESRAVLCN